MTTKTKFNSESYLQDNDLFNQSAELKLIIARRTAFIARFIVLREKKRNPAHKEIELLVWRKDTSAELLAKKFESLFVKHKKFSSSEERDISKAISHANRSLAHFVAEYNKRATQSFLKALTDYFQSNEILFGEEHRARCVGWRTPETIEDIINDLAEGQSIKLVSERLKMRSLA